MVQPNWNIHNKQGKDSQQGEDDDRAISPTYININARDTV